MRDPVGWPLTTAEHVTQTSQSEHSTLPISKPSFRKFDLKVRERVGFSLPLGLKSTQKSREEQRGEEMENEREAKPDDIVPLDPTTQAASYTSGLLP